MSNMTSAPHVVLGAHGAAGRAITAELIRQGQAVRAVVRGPIGPAHPLIHWIQADVTDAAQVAAATRGAAAVYHAAQPAYTRWPEEFPAMTDAILDGVAVSGAPLIVIDNLYMYGPVDGPLHEGLPMSARSRKGRVRAQMTDHLLSAHGSGQARVTIARFADYYGPAVQGSLVGATFFAAVLAGQPPLWYANADLPHSLTYVGDLGRAALLLAGSEIAAGSVWHIPADEALTARSFARLIAEEAGVEPIDPFVLPPQAVEAAATTDPMARELLELLYQVAQPFVLNGDRFARTFDFQPTSHREAVRATLQWQRGQVT